MVLCILLLICSSFVASAQAGNESVSHGWMLGPVLVTPSGFVESTMAFRSAGTGDGISTRFGSIPLAGTSDELVNSLRNSRAALEGKADLGGATLAGYVEADFLNRPPLEPLRFRQYWGEIKYGNWEILGGQAWSLLRPNRVGISTERDLMNTLVVDAGYHVGLLGYRNQQVRVVRHLNGGWQAGVSFENGRDVLPKIVHDSNWLHLELTGLVGGGGRRGASVAAVVHAGRKVDLVTQQFWSNHGGREALSTVPAAARTMSTLEGVELAIHKGSRLFAYGGLVRGSLSPGNRAVGEATFGFSQELRSGHHFASGVFSAQYSYFERNTWSNATGRMNCLMLSIRHYLAK